MTWIWTIALAIIAVIAAYFAFRKGRKMTEAQRKQWNECACIPRCLIKLANMNGNPINDDDFAAEFVFTRPGTNYDAATD